MLVQGRATVGRPSQSPARLFVITVDRVKALRTIYAEWAKGNLAAATHLLAPDVVYSGYSPDGVVKTEGLEELGRFLQQFYADWKDYRVEADEFLQLEADVVLVVGRHYGFGATSGVAAEDRVFNAWVFRDNQVIGLHFYPDRASALEAARLRT